MVDGRVIIVIALTTVKDILNFVFLIGILTGVPIGALLTKLIEEQLNKNKS